MNWIKRFQKDEFERALAWAKEKCKIGFDKNPDSVRKSDEVKDEQFEFVVKMAVIIKDLMNGNKSKPNINMNSCLESR